ncbi:MAG: DNA alkylation repair protein [Microgenomates group bacterium]
MDCQEVIKKLKSLANPKSVAGMAKYGIKTGKAWGISIPNLRKLAKEIGKDHELAQKLWKSGIHEARILASMIDEVEKVTEKQMDNWLSDFNSWDVCDQVCMNLFDKTPYAFEKAKEWSMRKEEFEKRGGFALMACLAWHDKESPNSKFIKFFPYIKRESTDERNYVKKAVNWALRQIGKKNLSLNKAAIKTAEEVQKIDSRAARWIAADALRELTSEAVQRRLVK